MKKMFVLGLLVVVALMLPAVAALDVTITVIDKDDNPLEDATVTIENSTDEICSGSTDEDGVLDDDCTLESNEDYTITVTHDDYQGIDDSKTLKDYDNDWKDVGVVMRPKTFDLTVTVCSGGSGSSCGASSDLIEGADVTIESLDETLTSADFDSYDKVVFPNEKSLYEAFEVDLNGSTQRTDGDGQAVVAGLEFNTRYNVTVEKSGYPTTWVEFDYPNDADDADVDIKLSDPGNASVTVVVYDQETGETIQEALVELKSQQGNEWLVIYEGATNQYGRATFTVSTPACYGITASKEGYDSDMAENECFENDDSVPSLPLFLTWQGGDRPDTWNNTITLVAGVWKLVSVPYELVDNDVEEVFPLKPPIGTGDDWVLRYNGTGWENPSMTVDPLKGYWVKSDTNATITLSYAAKDVDDLFPEIELKQGWNMIGHTEDKAQPIEAALYSLYDNGQPTFEIVYRWDGSNWQKYIPGVLAEFDRLYPGEGYWIKMKEDWTYTALDMNTVA